MSRPPAWIDITAEDAERSRAFYRDLLGWEIHVEESMDYGLVQPAPERLPGGIGQATGEGPHPPGVVVYFTVDDLEAALARAERLGSTCLVSPWELPGLGRMAVIGDPDGNRVGLWQTRDSPRAIVVTGHLELDPHDRDAFVADSIEFVRAARATAGCLDFAISADPIAAGRVNVLERWESEATLTAFRGDGPDDDSAARILGMHMHDYEVTPSGRA